MAARGRTRYAWRVSSPLATRSPLRVFPIDWGTLAPLRLRARAVAEGVYAGQHRSNKKGAGIEFGGQRPYVSGDDLRFLDRRSLLRHDRLMVREFLTETDRALWLVVDATASMAFRGKKAPGAKLAYAALLAAAAARVAVASGDPVALAWIGGEGVSPVPPSSGREGFARVVGALESVTAAGDLSSDETALARTIAGVAKRARRGSVVVLLSDLIDLPERAPALVGTLASQGRTVLAVQVLDPVESALDFDGHVRLRSLEGEHVVEVDAEAARPAYLARLEALRGAWRDLLESRGGHLVTATTTDDPASVLSLVLRASAGRLPSGTRAKKGERSP